LFSFCRDQKPPTDHPAFGMQRRKMKYASKIIIKNKVYFKTLVVTYYWEGLDNLALGAGL
jgi:hypothetical protein